MQECHDALKASIKRQNEIKAYYQSLVKHMTSQKESDEASLLRRIQLLEQENLYVIRGFSLLFIMVETNSSSSCTEL